MQLLNLVPAEKAFVLKDGRQVRTIYELIDELETMPQSMFKFFVNGAKNDFASWVNDVLDEPALATQLRRLQSKNDHQKAILKHLVGVLR